MPKHKFGMRIRYIIPLIISKKEQFVAYFEWDHNVDVAEYLEILRQHEPITFVPIGDQSIAFQLIDGDEISQDLREGTFDVKITLASEKEDSSYLTPSELLELIRKDDKWMVV